MPIYEYKCEACGRVTAVLRRMTDRDRVEQCPACYGYAFPVLSATRTDFKFADKSAIKRMR